MEVTIDDRSEPIEAVQPTRCSRSRKDVPTMLWTIIVVLLALWLVGIIASIGGGLVHLLLLVAGIILIAQLVSGRSRAT
jgi:Family of unknown function (DUF5670)